MSSTPEYKQCPDCAEQVLAAARRCRFCGYRFDQGRKERRSPRSPLLELMSGFRPGSQHATMTEMLADWGVRLVDAEEIVFFCLADVDEHPGYVLVTSERLVFFAQSSRGEHEKVLEHDLFTLTEVRVVGGRLRRRLELRGYEFAHVLKGPAGAKLEELADYLGGPLAPG